MRKIAVFAVLALCLGLSVTGCSTAKASEDSAATTTVTTTATTKVEVSPYITEEQAIAAAEGYFGIENRSFDQNTGYQLFYHVMQTPTEEDPRYKVFLQWQVGENGHMSNLDFVWVDAVTGETHYEA